MNNIRLLDKNQVSSFFGDVIGIAANTLDKLDIFDSDGWLSSIPFGKMATWVAKKIVEKPIEVSLHQAISFSIASAMMDGVLKLNLNPYFNESSLNLFGEKLKSRYKEANKSVLGSFDLDNYLNTPLVKDYLDLYSHFLNYSDLNSLQKTWLITKLERYSELHFRLLLKDENGIFNKLSSLINSEAFNEWKKVYKLEEYSLMLGDMFRGVALNDEKGMTLEHIYVAPFFNIYSRCLISEDKFSKERGYFIKCQDLNYKKDIHSFVDKVIKGQKPVKEVKPINPSSVFIYGYPGQGKSSFCKKQIFDWLNIKPINKDVFYIKLVNILNPMNLIDNPLEEVQQYLSEKFYLSNILNRLKNSILILDGLDELKLKYKLNENDIENICNRIIEYGELYDNLKIIVTARYGYINLNSLPLSEVLVLQLQEFNETQQLRWLSLFNDERFGRKTTLTKERIKLINQSKGNYLSELISQPLLLQMIASVESEIDLDANRSLVYKILFDEITQRKWEEGRQIPTIKNITPSILRKYLRELGFEIFKSGFNYLHQDEILELEATRDFLASLNLKKFPLEQASRTMMVSFYFNKVVPSNKNIKDSSNYPVFAIEFLHSSLQEYLTAEKIWVDIKQRFLQKNNNAYVLDTKEEQFQLLDNLFSERILSNEVVQYLVEIIKNDSSISREELTKRLSSYFEWFLSNDFLFSYNLDAAQKPTDKAIATFYGYWVILIHLVPYANYIDGEEVLNLFSSFILHPIFRKSKLFLQGQNLSSLNLEGISLENANMVGAKFIQTRLQRASFKDASLIYAELDEAQLDFINLSGANLEKAIFKRASLENANLFAAKIWETDFEGANLQRANLISADLRTPNLGSTNLKYTILDNANLEKVYLRGSNLDMASLVSSNLKNAFLEEVSIECTRFEDAFLKGVKLSKAFGRGANFIKTDLSNSSLNEVHLAQVTFKNAQMQNSDLSNAIFEYSYFTEANLVKSNLSNSNFSGSCFENANLNLAILDNAIFQGVNFRGAIFCSGESDIIKQFQNVQTLFASQNLDFKIVEILKRNLPNLFVEPRIKN